MKKLFIILVLLAVFIPSMVEAKSKPLPYHIDNARITQHNGKITLEWNQVQSALVVVYKLSYKRTLNNNCYDSIDRFQASCTMVWQRTGLIGNIRVTDKHYKSGDEYYIIQYVYQSHNGGYGPYKP